jgi:hypothetical protein
MLVWPLSRRMLIAVFLRVAMTWGPLPVRICEWSSAPVVMPRGVWRGHRLSWSGRWARVADSA